MNKIIKKGKLKYLIFSIFNEKKTNDLFYIIAKNNGMKSIEAEK